MESKVIRNSNLELLRIVSMFLIISGHLTLQSNILLCDTPNKYFAIFMGSGYGIANNIFVLISAYFLTEKDFHFNRIIKIYFEVAFITIPLSLLMLFIAPNYLSIKDLVRSFFPYSGSPLWFASCYISMLFFSPFLNELVTKKEKCKIILALLFFINVIPSTFLFRNDFFYSGELLYFCFLYLLVGYFKKYNKNLFEKKASLCLVIAILIYVILCALNIGVDILSQENNLIKKISEITGIGNYFIERYHTLPSLICSISLFIFFLKLKIKKNTFINLISSGLFSSYILHQTPTFAPYMWNRIFKVDTWLFSNKYILYYLMTVVIIIIAGNLINMIRKKIFDKIIFNTSIIKKIDSYFQKKYEKGIKI